MPAYRDIYIPIYYDMKADTITIKDIDSTEKTVIDVDTGFVKILNTKTGECYYKVNTDGSLYVMPKEEIESYIKVSNKTMGQLDAEKK